MNAALASSHEVPRQFRDLHEQEKRDLVERYARLHNVCIVPDFDYSPFSRAVREAFLSRDKAELGRLMYDAISAYLAEQVECEHPEWLK